MTVSLPVCASAVMSVQFNEIMVGIVEKSVGVTIEMG